MHQSSPRIGSNDKMMSCMILRSTIRLQSQAWQCKILSEHTGDNMSPAAKSLKRHFRILSFPCFVFIMIHNDQLLAHEADRVGFGRVFVRGRIGGLFQRGDWKNPSSDVAWICPRHGLMSTLDGPIFRDGIADCPEDRAKRGVAKRGVEIDRKVKAVRPWRSFNTPYGSPCWPCSSATEWKRGQMRKGQSQSESKAKTNGWRPIHDPLDFRSPLVLE